MENNPLQDFTTSTGVRIALIGVLAILSLFLVAQTFVLIDNFGRPGAPATDTITVTGDGKAMLAPDIAHISFTVQNTAATVALAQAATTKQANAAIAFIKEQGVADKDVTTSSYSIYPQYSYPNPCTAGAVCPDYSRTPKITGYQVSESIQVKLRDLSAVGTFLGGLGKLEVQNVSGPDFTLDDTTAGYTAARADAIAKAQEQAKILARQLDVRLGKIVNFSESSGNYPYPMMAYGMGGADSTKTASVPELPAGDNTYTASVSITYEIR